VPSALGGNVGRLEDILALPLVLAFLWPRPRFTRRVALPLIGIPLALTQWAPAWSAMTAGHTEPSTHEAYFVPLLGEVNRLMAAGPAGRLEVVPTKFHWESAFVAPTVPLARGWERQLDEGDDPLFYGAGRLDGASYRSWLLDNGVRFVALPDAPLDYAGIAEGHLVAAGVPGLHLVWRSQHWRLFEVLGSSGIVAAPARLVSQKGTRVVVSTPVPGPVLVRVRYSPNWQLASGSGCIAPAPAPGGVPGGGTWVRVEAPVAEQFSLRLSLLPVHQSCSSH
jgi:hypothetical protein